MSDDSPGPNPSERPGSGDPAPIEPPVQPPMQPPAQPPMQPPPPTAPPGFGAPPGLGAPAGFGTPPPAAGAYGPGNYGAPPPPGGYGAPPPPVPGYPQQFAGGPPGGQRSNGMAIASLVVGIIGLLTFWACGFGALLGLVAVILGFVGLRAAKDIPGEPQKGLAIGGIVTGGLAMLAGIGMVLALFVFGSTVDDIGELNSDPSDGTCDDSRYWQDPDC